MSACKYCGLIFEGRKLSGHTGHCKMNPGRTQKNFSKMSALSHEKDKTNPYTQLKLEFPIHYHRFKLMIQRAGGKHLRCDYSFTYRSFKKFVDDIGPIPNEMIRPTVGRYDHSEGYYADNFRWQEHLDNLKQGTKTMAL